MGLVCTNKSDTVEVTVKTPGGDFKITVGTIPYHIGKQLDDLNLSTLKVIRRIKAGDAMEDCTIEMNKVKGEIDLLYLKYGLRGHSGLEYANGETIPCDTEEDEDGATVLTEESLNLFKGNDQFLSKASTKIARVKKVGIGKYISETKEGKTGEEIENEICGGAAENSPLAKELEQSLVASILSPTQNTKD